MAITNSSLYNFPNSSNSEHLSLFFDKVKMSAPNSKQSFLARLGEDWLAVIIAFLLILLSVIGLIGPNGIKLVF